MTLTSEQRTRIQQTVLAGRNVPRVDNVNFALNVGIAVPATVRVVDVPPTLIEIYPQWRGHQYFVVRDEIVIVDRSRKIVATVPVGSSGGAAQLGGPGGGARLGTGTNLSADEIRQVQIALREKGFYRGEPDGVPGDNAGVDQLPAPAGLPGQRTNRHPDCHRTGGVECIRAAG